VIVLQNDIKRYQAVSSGIKRYQAISSGIKRYQAVSSEKSKHLQLRHTSFFAINLYIHLIFLNNLTEILAPALIASSREAP
tara:strand:- start:4445 stop:4687 length:243 start_codon:yes stop_codon:yes gene_type:complete